MQLTFSNFHGSWAGLPVAWSNANEFDENTYRGDIARCCKIGAPGVYSGGTTGEFYAVEFDEFKQIARAMVEEAHHAGKPAMIGVSSTFTLGAARRAAYAAELGADAIQVTLPFWMPLPDDQVLGFFREVSGAAGHIPLSIYETLRAKKALTYDQHQAIKSELPNYLMVKANENTLGVTEAGCKALAAIGINVFGDEGLWPVLGPHGMTGCCSSFVYYVPDIILPLNRALEGQNWTEVARLAAMVEKLGQLTLKFVPKGLFDSAIDRLGGVAGGVLRTSLYCRGPYAHGSDEDVQIFREWYKNNMPEVYADIKNKLSLE